MELLTKPGLAAHGKWKAAELGEVPSSQGLSKYHKHTEEHWIVCAEHLATVSPVLNTKCRTDTKAELSAKAFAASAITLRHALVLLPAFLFMTQLGLIVVLLSCFKFSKWKGSKGPLLLWHRCH